MDRLDIAELIEKRIQRYLKHPEKAPIVAELQTLWMEITGNESVPEYLQQASN